jgi:hypothetical protein
MYRGQAPVPLVRGQAPVKVALQRTSSRAAKVD